MIRIQFVAPVMLLALCSGAYASSINFGVDPFEGTNVRNVPGRQVVGGEFFAAFHVATEGFVFDQAAFAMGDQIHFANGFASTLPTTGLNAIVLEDLDNDANPLTPFGAANAADLLANRITQHGPGVFVYFNSSLNLPRLVYSDDLASSAADLRILARFINLNGQTGIDTLPLFSAQNFDISSGQTVPEPSSGALIAGICFVFFTSVRRRLGWRRRFL